MIFFITGGFALVLSLFLTFFPKPFLNISEFFNRVFFADDIAMRYRIGIGICLILISFLLFFTAYYLAKT